MQENGSKKALVRPQLFFPADQEGKGNNQTKHLVKIHCRKQNKRNGII